MYLLIEGEKASQTNDINPKQRQRQLGTNLVDPYYAFNPDYNGGNMPNVQLYPNNANNILPSSCACACGDASYGPPVSCVNPQTCVAYCLQMYPGQCTLVNTYGCCGASCQYFYVPSLETQHCTCNCAGQQFLNPIDTCTSSQSCLTRCLNNFPQACTTLTTQACCGQDCQTYSQAVADSCACRCQGNTYYPSPKCFGPEGCVSTCMTVRIYSKKKHIYIILKLLFRLMVIVQQVKLKVVVEHYVLHMFQHVHVIVVQILQQQLPFLVEAVEHV